MNAETGKIYSDTEIAELQRRLNTHRTEKGLSWSEIADQTGVAQGTISVWASGKYNGNNSRIAAQIERYFGAYEVQLELIAEVPTQPGYQPTPSSRRIVNLLRWAATGKIVAAACAPGIGKTTSAMQFQAESPNVWIATMSPSTSSVQTMQLEVLDALGDREAKGTPQMLSRRIMSRVSNSRGLIIIDEAHHLGERPFDELRSWNDKTGIGIALLGQEELITRLSGETKKRQFAQVSSRIAMRHLQSTCLREDVDMLVDAWGIHDPHHLNYLRHIAAKPGALRQMSMTIELAMFVANGERKPLALHHLKDAWTQLSSRPVA